MSMQLQSTSTVLSLEKTELTAIKSEPPESEISIDDIPNSLDEEIIRDIKDIDIVSHMLFEDLIKSETVSENILLIKTENITQNEYLYKTQDISDGNLSSGTSQGVIEVQGFNEHFKHACNKNKSTQEQNKKRCKECLLRTYHYEKLKLHELTHKTEAKMDDPHFKYRCDKCKYKTCRADHFKRHKLIHLKPKQISYFYCYHCPSKCKEKCGLKRHIFNHFKKEEVSFHCYICDFTTLKRNLIIEHFKKHPKHHSKCDEMDYKNQLETYTKKQISYSCKKCSFKTYYYNSLKRHELTHKIEAEMDDRHFKYRCDKCKYKTFRHQSFKRHKLIHLKPKQIPYFYCYHCPYKSNQKDSLKRHIFSHFKNEEVPFHCYICDFTTLKRNLIIEHFKKHPKHHSKCDEIDYKNQLDTYAKKQMRCYRCKKCAFKTCHYEKLELHELTHKTEAETDDRHFKYRCDKCKYKTFRHQDFKTHKLIHLKPEEIQYLYCYHCSYKSSRRATLKIHIFNHFKKEEVPFLCYICEFTTLGRNLIIEHFKKHPKHHSKWNETDYKNQLKIPYFYCYHCSYKSKRKQDLKRHIFRHFKNEEIPFHCYICDFVTLKRKSFMKHLKHHKCDETEYRNQLLRFYKIM